MKSGMWTGCWMVLLAVSLGGTLLPAADAMAQDEQATEVAADEPTGTSQPGEQPADDDQQAPDATDATDATDDSGAEPDAPPAADADQPPTTDAADDPPAEQDDADAGPGVSAGKGDDDAGAAAGQQPTGLSPLAIGALLLALFVVPVLVGNWLAKLVSMPDHAWKISLVLGTLSAAGVIIAVGEFTFGPDLAGGITLIYELADTATVVVDEDAPDPDEGEDDGRDGRQVDIPRLIEALKQRVDPTGTREVTIRQYGQAIEIIIPQTDQADLEYVKRRITDLGQLEFRITADPSFKEDQPIIEQARTNPPGQKNVILNGETVAQWVRYAEAEFGRPDQEDDRIVKRMAGDVPEALVKMDPWNVTGEHLTSATKGVDQRGSPAVNFAFDNIGSRRFGRLTGENKPNQATGAVRYLGIVLDNRLISAPSIRERITGSGRISGGAMNEQEVEFIISILNAGSLPAALNKEPISEEIISPTLGAETIEKGSYAIGASLIAVAAFLPLYYRFAGIVACFALVANFLLVLGVMVLINAAFTLPGLAGLVLMVGMSVDANVLIFERIREELSRGAALRMAIRNGFSRATTTIVDANLTTLITGVVLYAIGTDQIKGFAVTLILGILMSMYTAIFCARLIFDIAERRRWITELSMVQMLGATNFDFIGKRYVAAAGSLILIGIGLAAVFMRGSGILNIDFTGGTSVTMVLDKGYEMSVAEVRGELVDTELADKNLLVVERGQTQTNYTISSNVDSVEKVQQILSEAFAGKLKTYSVEILELTPFAEGDYSGTEATLTINDSPDYGEDAGIGHDSLVERINQALEAAGHSGVEPSVTNDFYQPGSAARYKEWTVRLPLDESATQTVLEGLRSKMNSAPMFPLASKIGGKVAGDMQVQAAYAIFISLLGIIGYLWLRFQKVTFGLAAVVALVHDVLVTLGMIAISAYVVNAVPVLADALQIDSFQISLPIVAAFLTIIGYSLNDTIVVFDRIREVRGKSPQMTADMINISINQTLNRTLLTSLTTLVVVVILYFFGGAGIHGFAFALVVGVIVGTYSSIFVASPALLAMMGGNSNATPAPPAE